MTNRRGRSAGGPLWGGLLLAGISILLCMAAAEGWLRFREAQEASPFEYDPTLGWNAKLHFSGRSRSPEFDISVRTNGQHMRAPRDYAPQPTGLRIAVVGDSFVWGHGVEIEERFSDRLEAALGPEAEVLNFGIGGFGTDQYLLKIETEVVSFHPDVLVVAFFLNDIMELDKGTGILEIPKPHYALRGGELQLLGVPVPRAAGWDERRGVLDFLLLDRLRQALSASEVAAVPARPAPAADHFYRPNFHMELLQNRPEKRERLERLLRLNARLYREIRDVADRGSMRLVVAEVPFKEFFISDEILRAHFELDRRQVDFGCSQRELARLAGELGFSYVNPYAAFAADDPLENYFRRDQHLNSRGHAALAQVVVEALREEGLLPTR